MKKRLGPPKVITFWISVILIAIGMVGYYTEAIDLSTDTAFLLVWVGGVLLAIGAWFKGI